jgi:exodeoxyribonuclease III
VKIATFSINGINRRLSLQELKAANSEFPAQAIRDAGYSAVREGQRAWNGVAILARGVEPIGNATRLPGDPSYHQSRYLKPRSAASSTSRL